jgi:hypothetical protein
VFFFGLFAPNPQTADRPPGHLGLSAWDFADCLSPLLLELRFHVAFSWGLFLWLVGQL